MRDISPADRIEIRQIAAGAEVELWEVDATHIGGDRHFFCNEVNELGQHLVWKGQAYQAYPCQGSGFDWSGQGPSSRPKLTLSNLTGLITGLCEDYEDMVGAVVTRQLVGVKWLDAVNFAAGNPHADPSQPRLVARYLIERLVDLDDETASFELASPAEMDGAILPARPACRTCPWVYRGDDCGYDGPPVADDRDQPTTDPDQDQCSRLISGCELRYPGQPLPFGGLPLLTNYG